MNRKAVKYLLVSEILIYNCNILKQKNSDTFFSRKLDKILNEDKRISNCCKYISRLNDHVIKE